MNELIQDKNDASIRWKLLTGVSALVLTSHIASLGIARAEDADHPTVWIELGGQLSRLQGGQETFSPPLMDGRPSIFEPSQKFEKAPGYSFDGTGTISIQPEHSDWAFSVSGRFGRSKSDKHVLQQTNPKGFQVIGYDGSTINKYPAAQRFADTTTHTTEQHVILDFQAGRDVALGLFGTKNITSVISVGARFAQFTSRSNISLKSDPDWHFNYKYNAGVKQMISYGQVFHSNLASMTAKRSFHGVGPSVSWKASAPLAGNEEDGAVVLDWGLNASVLFGRQRAQTHHQSTARLFSKYFPILTGTAVPHTIGRYPVAPDHTRSRGVTVPNIGGFAGLSFKYINAKVSMGYRADYFFGAMDGGIDTVRKADVGFYGPFATISVGLGG